MEKSDPQKYVWTKEMGEITGMGGGYEECTQAGLRAALEWFDANPDADPKFKGFKNVMGICTDDNKDATAMSEAIMTACRPLGGLTGAMHQAIVQHALVIKAKGWDEYVAKMCEREKEEAESASPGKQPGRPSPTPADPDSN